MSAIKRTILIFIIFIPTFLFSQNIVVKYIGLNDENTMLSCQSIETLKNPILLNLGNRILNIKNENPTTILCNQINRNTKIFAIPNDTIEFDINYKGLINYYSKANHYRKTESEFINDCFEKYGATENLSDYNELKQIRVLGNISKYFDSVYLKEQQLLNTYYNADKISKEFYLYFTNMYWCLIKYNELENKENKLETFLSIENTFNQVEIMLPVDEYRSLLENYVKKSIEKLQLKNDLFSKMNFVTTTITNQKIKDYLLYTYINSALNDSKSTNIINKTIIDLFRKNCTNQAYLDVINVDLKPKTTPLLIQNIIKKHAGKLVLVDFWASWCMPCREEFPSEKKLMEKYTNVAFIFLSIDKSTSAWQKAMAEYNYILNRENSFLLIKSEKDELLKKINLASIPRFVLFGKDGKIINFDAPRPSSREIEQLIEKHL